MLYCPLVHVVLFVFFPAFLFVCSFASQLQCLYVRLLFHFVYLLDCLLVCLFVFLFACLLACLLVCFFNSLVELFVCLSACLSACVFACISFVSPQFASFHSVFHSFHGLMDSINWPAPSVWSSQFRW